MYIYSFKSFTFLWQMARKKKLWKLSILKNKNNQWLSVSFGHFLMSSWAEVAPLNLARQKNAISWYTFPWG